MSAYRTFIFIFVSFNIFFFTYTVGQGPVDDYCVNCICEDGCAISFDYWKDGGRPTINGDNARSEYAYDNCVKSYDCQAKAIQNYMFRYEKDCNGDGRIDCSDHAAIHRHGADGCASSRPDDIFQFQIYNCLNNRRK